MDISRQDDNDPSRLDYFPSGPTQAVVLTRLMDVNHAEIISAALNDRGIPARVLGSATGSLGMAAGTAGVEIVVPFQDAERAREIMESAQKADFEPAEGEESTEDRVDADGHRLCCVGEYEALPQIRLAQTLLAAERIESMLPVLVMRNENASAPTRRFVLRVRENDVREAREILRELEEDEEPRCPWCGSKRLYEEQLLWQRLVCWLKGKRVDAKFECLNCKRTGEGKLFIRHMGRK